MLLSNSTYDKLKWFVQIVIPAFAALYFGLGDYWDLPKVTEVVGSCSVVAVFLGAILGISSKQYESSDEKYDGTIVITKNEEGKKLYSLELKEETETIDNKNDVVFKTESHL